MFSAGIDLKMFANSTNEYSNVSSLLDSNYQPSRSAVEVLYRQPLTGNTGTNSRFTRAIKLETVLVVYSYECNLQGNSGLHGTNGTLQAEKLFKHTSEICGEFTCLRPVLLQSIEQE